jgi:LCP family protein required for cell wall assembly
MPDEPDYKVYRSRPRLHKGRDDKVAEGLQELRDAAPDAPRQPGAKPEYTVHRRRRLPRPSLPGGRITRRRVVKLVLSAIGGWILLSLVLFMISAWIQGKNTSDAARSALTGTGYTLTSANTILVLGSDAREPGYAEPGAAIGGPSRSDSILLIRAGGGKSAKLSIPRDTVVDIPGHGPDKINAAYAIGGPSLTIQTVENYLGIKINHIVEVDFGNFPEFIDALGGVDVRTNCVRSDINGGRKNGGTSLRLKPGEHHLSGKQALTLARTRKNACHPEENDLDRAKRQQDVLAAIKSRLLSPTTFFRLPWVAWEAPKAIKTDMGGPSLLGLFGAIEIGGNPKPAVLGELQAGGGVGATDAEKAAAVRKFLKG